MTHRILTPLTSSEQWQQVPTRIPDTDWQGLNLLSQANGRTPTFELSKAADSLRYAVHVGEIALDDFHTSLGEHRHDEGRQMSVPVMREMVDWVADSTPRGLQDVTPFLRLSIVRHLLQPDNAQIASRMHTVRSTMRAHSLLREF